MDVLCRIRSKFSDVMINGTGLLCGIQPINVNNAVRVISNDGGIIPDAFECSTFKKKKKNNNLPCRQSHNLDVVGATTGVS